MKRKLSVATVTHGVDVCSQLRYRKLTPAISGDGGGNLSWDNQCQSGGSLHAEEQMWPLSRKSTQRLSQKICGVCGVCGVY